MVIIMLTPFVKHVIPIVLFGPLMRDDPDQKHRVHYRASSRLK